MRSCKHKQQASDPSFPWQLVDSVVFPRKASSPLRNCSTISCKQAVLCLPLSFKSSGFLWVSAFLQMCVQALPRLHARITDFLPLNSLISEMLLISETCQKQLCLSFQTWEGPDTSSQKNRISKNPSTLLLHTSKNKLFFCSSSGLKSKRNSLLFMGFTAGKADIII